MADEWAWASNDSPEHPTTPPSGYETAPLHTSGGGAQSSDAQGASTSAPGSRRRRRMRTILGGSLAGLALLGGGIGVGLELRGSGTSTAAATPVGGGAPVRAVVQAHSATGGTGLNIQRVANTVDPAVVDITSIIGGSSAASSGGSAGGFGNPFGGSTGGSSPFAPGGSFGGGGQPTAEAAGTGMIITPTGEIMTNNHVIEGATKITVTIPGHSGSFRAKVVGANPVSDVALLQVSGVSNLPTVTFANSSTVAVGQPVVDIGNALGQGGAPTVTNGIVSSLHRSITAGNSLGSTEHLTNMLQTDAPINPGDSGGPLVNSAGQVIGMVTAAATGSSTQPASNVGYAIPVNRALGIVNQIRSGHASAPIVLGQPPIIGVDVQTLTSGAASQLGLSSTSGVLVVGVVPGDPAAAAGIGQYAVITAVDGHSVTSLAQLSAAIRAHAVGQHVTVTWTNPGGGSQTASVALVAGPAV